MLFATSTFLMFGTNLKASFLTFSNTSVGDFDVSIPRKLKEDNQIRLKEWAAKFAPEAKLCVCFGHVNEQVMKYADELHADLIVMGTHINMGVKELLNASHAQYIAMHTAIPIMTLKCDRSDLQVKSIVLASSFKIGDVPHCEMALALQKAFNAKLYLLRVNTSDDFLPDGEVEKTTDAAMDAVADVVETVITEAV